MRASTLSRGLIALGLCALPLGLYTDRANATPADNGTVSYTGDVAANCTMITDPSQQTYGQTQDGAISGNVQKLEVSETVDFNCNSASLNASLNLSSIAMTATDGTTYAIGTDYDHKIKIESTGTGAATIVAQELANATSTAHAADFDHPEADLKTFGVKVTSTVIPGSAKTQLPAGTYSATGTLTITAL